MIRIVGKLDVGGCIDTVILPRAALAAYYMLDGRGTTRERRRCCPSGRHGLKRHARSALVLEILRHALDDGQSTSGDVWLRD